MAHESFIFTSEKEIPVDILNKIPDLIYLFRSEGDWLITNKMIKYTYYSAFFFMEREIGYIMSKSLVTQNMIEVFEWMCDNMTLEMDCWNVNDFEYGPSDIDDFRKQVLSIAEEYQNMTVKNSLDALDINFAAMMLNPKENIMSIFIGGCELKYKLDKKITYVSIYNASIRDGVIEFECSYEDDDENSDLHTEYIILNDLEFENISLEEENRLKNLILYCEDIEVINYYDWNS